MVRSKFAFLLVVPFLLALGCKDRPKPDPDELFELGEGTARYRQALKLSHYNSPQNHLTLWSLAESVWELARKHPDVNRVVVRVVIENLEGGLGLVDKYGNRINGDPTAPDVIFDSYLIREARKYHSSFDFAHSEDVHTLFDSEIKALKVLYPKLFKEHELFSGGL